MSYRLTLSCSGVLKEEIGATTPTSEQPEQTAREDLVNLALRRTQGRLPRAGWGFTIGFPYLDKEIIPSHLIQVIPTAGGATSVAEAQAADRDRRGEGRTES